MHPTDFSDPNVIEALNNACIILFAVAFGVVSGYVIGRTEKR